MRSAADSSPFFLSPPWSARVLRSCAALALAATLAACGGGDGGGSAGTSATAGSAGTSTSAKPDDAATDGNTPTKKDDDVRYAP